MKYKTYREIPVSERLPEFEGVHTVVDADLNMFQAVYDKEFGFNSEFEDCSGITHWLEEFEVTMDTVSILKIARLSGELQGVADALKFESTDRLLVCKSINQIAEQLTTMVKNEL